MPYAYKFRIYPNKTQAEKIEQTFGCSRFVYNVFLQSFQTAYAKTGAIPSFNEYRETLKILKRERPWLSEVDATALQSALWDLEQNCKSSIQKGHRDIIWPRFKSKKTSHKSYRSRNNREGSNIVVTENYVRLPKIGKVACQTSREVRGNISMAVVSQQPSGKYFVSLICKGTVSKPLEHTQASVIITRERSGAITLSNGMSVVKPKYIDQSLIKLEKESRCLARKKHGSSNWKKQRRKIAVIQEYIDNQYIDALHKQSMQIIRENQTVYIADLRQKGKTKSEKKQD